MKIFKKRKNQDIKNTPKERSIAITMPVIVILLKHNLKIPLEMISRTMGNLFGEFVTCHVDSYTIKSLTIEKSQQLVVVLPPEYYSF